jgi:hypothetical protein
MEALNKSVRIEPVEMQSSQVKGFDRLSPNWFGIMTIVIMADHRIVIPAKAGIQERTGARSLPSGVFPPSRE